MSRRSGHKTYELKGCDLSPTQLKHAHASENKHVRQALGALEKYKTQLQNKDINAEDRATLEIDACVAARSIMEAAGVREFRKDDVESKQAYPPPLIRMANSIEDSDVWRYHI